MAKPTPFARLLGWCGGALLLLGCDSLKPEKPSSETQLSSATENAQAATGGNAATTAGQLRDTDASSDATAPTGPATDSTSQFLFDSQPPLGDGVYDDLIPPDSDDRTSDSTSDSAVDQNEFQQQLLGSLGKLDAQEPAELVMQLQKIDGAIQDLMSASANNMVDEATFRSSGRQLGQLKLTAAQKLTGHAAASDAQRKAGQLAQLIALSHLSGFRDVEAARQLEKYAAELTASSDLDLAHQGRVVLMGFQLQSLQNGVSSDPNELLASAEGLFTREVDRNFPELMILLQSSQVLDQMGFDEAANRMDAIIVQEFRQASDPKLRNEAWNIETRGSQALENYLIAFRNLSGEAFDTATAMAAARRLLVEFTSVLTLEQLASTVVSIEYGGNMTLSRELVELIETNLSQFAPSEQTRLIEQTVAGSKKRFAMIGQPLSLNGLVGFDGQPFRAADYGGKLVLVDFWASWCTNCLNEIPEIRRVHQELGSSGFEVISINMDENLKAAQDFVAKRNFPWKSYHAADLGRLGFKSVFAEELGIVAIPFMVLVDSDGNVVDIHVRGDKLMPAAKVQLDKRPSLIPAE